MLMNPMEVAINKIIGERVGNEAMGGGHRRSTRA